MHLTKEGKSVTAGSFSDSVGFLPLVATLFLAFVNISIDRSIIFLTKSSPHYIKKK